MYLDSTIHRCHPYPPFRVVTMGSAEGFSTGVALPRMNVVRSLFLSMLVLLSGVLPRMNASRFISQCIVPKEIDSNESFDAYVSYHAWIAFFQLLVYDPFV